MMFDLGIGADLHNNAVEQGLEGGLQQDMGQSVGLYPPVVTVHIHFMAKIWHYRSGTVGVPTNP